MSNTNMSRYVGYQKTLFDSQQIIRTISELEYQVQYSTDNIQQKSINLFYGRYIF